MSDRKREFVFTLTAETIYSTKQIRASIVEITEEGMRNPGHKWPYTDLGFKDLYLYQFVDNMPTQTNIEYCQPHSVDLEYAEAMVKMLRTITRGLAKIRDAEGYVDINDLPLTLFRVARVLKIKTFYVRNTDQAYRNSGERWRKADAGSVQYWYDQAKKNIADGKISTYDLRG